MADFINTTGFIGNLIVEITTKVTGSETLTFIFILMILIGLMSLFKIPLEFQSIFLLPLIIVLMAFNSTFIIIGGILLFFIAILWVKNWFF